MSKYAPANDDGLAPYTVTLQRWGRRSDKVVYAKGRTDARWQALGRGGVGEYVVKVRRTLTSELTSAEEPTTGEATRDD